MFVHSLFITAPSMDAWVVSNYLLLWIMLPLCQLLIQNEMHRTTTKLQLNMEIIIYCLCLLKPSYGSGTLLLPPHAIIQSKPHGQAQGQRWKIAALMAEPCWGLGCKEGGRVSTSNTIYWSLVKFCQCILKDTSSVHKVSSHVIWKIETFIEEDTRYKKHCT